MKIIYALKKIIFYSIIVIAVIALGISIYNIVYWQFDNKNSDEEMNNISNNTTINEVTDSGNAELINPASDQSDIYWQYINTSMIDVDFTSLLETNSDTIGWIQVPGTKINYPFVQTDNNDYYLTHTFYKKKNEGGWVFLDYRNDGLGNDNNSIIYAHGRVNGTMFGSLKETVEGTWRDNTENHIVKISTPTENTLWQVFSVYIIPTTNDYIQVYFSDDNEYSTWLNKITDRSAYPFATTVTTEDKILTLSTCYNNTEKVVLHAKLIKREAKVVENS